MRARLEFMKTRSSLWVGAGLVTLGLVGLIAVLIVLGSYVPPSGTPSTASGGQNSLALGERLFGTGTDANGNPVPRTGGAPAGMMNAGGGCAGCHGTDGRGRTVSSMMASFTAPDIRWSVLTSTESTESGGSASTPFDEASFARAVRDGLDPEGQPLEPPMPHWQLTDQEMRDLIAYVKTL